MTPPPKEVMTLRLRTTDVEAGRELGLTDTDEELWDFFFYSVLALGPKCLLLPKVALLLFLWIMIPKSHLFFFETRTMWGKTYILLDQGRLDELMFAQLC